MQLQDAPLHVLRRAGGCFAGGNEQRSVVQGRGWAWIPVSPGMGGLHYLAARKPGKGLRHGNGGAEDCGRSLQSASSVPSIGGLLKEVFQITLSQFFRRGSP